MSARLWHWFCENLRLQTAIYKKTIVWCVLWLAAGVILAIVSLMVGGIGAGDINTQLIDGNILNMAAKDASIGGFLWQRVLSLLLPVLLVLLAALLGRVTALIIFPLMLMHGYWLCISFWWTWQYFSFNALLLLLFYGVWLVLVTALLVAGCLWAVQTAAAWRECRGRRWGLVWDLVQGVFWLLVAALVCGFVEFLVFWLLLGKIVYKPV